MGAMIVTGASRGIGAATALLAGQKGYSVVVNYRDNREAAEEVVDSIASEGGDAIAVAADISDEKEVADLFGIATEEFGQLTALVNNAGILHPQCDLQQMSVERLTQVFSTNVIGSLLCAREAVSLMSTDNGGAGGSIVNLLSIAATLGSPNEYVDYAASKGAIDSFTVGLASEVASQNIRVNDVRPGVIYTDIHASGGEPDRVNRVKGNVPMQRGGEASEVAQAVMWLVSDDASYTTGAFINVSGGR